MVLITAARKPIDLYPILHRQLLVNDAVKRGFVVFNTEVKCIQCHFGSNFTTNEFRNIGLFNGKDLNDSGRAVISHVADDIGKFKVAA